MDNINHHRASTVINAQQSVVNRLIKLNGKRHANASLTLATLLHLKKQDAPTTTIDELIAPTYLCKLSKAETPIMSQSFSPFLCE